MKRCLGRAGQDFWLQIDGSPAQIQSGAFSSFTNCHLAKFSQKSFSCAENGPKQNEHFISFNSNYCMLQVPTQHLCEICDIKTQDLEVGPSRLLNVKFNYDYLLEFNTNILPK